ncbi:hypothetical protein [Streptomyces sp. NPDC057910]|uniref:hypothetical protein n=1 Tax=Streptomyces sp. NPDC057910 TaxID=3346278 RepID=UPI0036E15A23
MKLSKTLAMTAVMLVLGAAAATGPAYAATSASQTPSLTARSSSLSPFNVLIEQSDNGKTIRIPRGTGVFLNLKSDGRLGRWSIPTASDAAVLRLTGSTLDSDGYMRTYFDSGVPGTSTIKAVESFSPSMVIVPFEVTIVVGA